MLRNGVTPDGYKVDNEGRWLPNGVTTTTSSASSTSSTTSVEETTSKDLTLKEAVEPTTEATTTSEAKSIPVNGDKASN